MIKKGEEAEVSEAKVEAEQAPTETQQLETLKAQIEALSARAETAEKSNQGLKASRIEREAVLKSYTDNDTWRRGIEESLETLTFAVGNKGNYAEDGEELSKFVAKQTSDRKTRQAEDKASADAIAYNAKANAILDRAKEVFKDNPDMIERVEDDLYGGRLDRAESKLVKEVPKVEKPKETEGEAKERHIKEYMLANGEINTETSMPAGTGKYTPKQVEDMSPEEYAKNADKLWEAVDKA